MYTCVCVCVHTSIRRSIHMSIHKTANLAAVQVDKSTSLQQLVGQGCLDAMQVEADLGSVGQ